MSAIRVVIVDDHPLFRQGLRQVLEADGRFHLAGECDTGAAALSLIQSLQPDLAVLDLNLPDLSGLEVAKALLAGGCPTRLVILTMTNDEQAFNAAINLGVQGYVLKENAVSEIVRCIQTVAAGTPYLSPSLSAFLVRRLNRASDLAASQPKLEDLTIAEKRILKRIAENKTTKEIALELLISPRTVETHRARICAKLSLKGANSLLRFALENRDALSGLN